MEETQEERRSEHTPGRVVHRTELCRAACALSSAHRVWGEDKGLPRIGQSGKKHTRGGVGHMHGCEGTVLNREVVNPVWAGYPTLDCVPSFRKGLSPCSRVEGRLKWSNVAWVGMVGRCRGVLQGKPPWFVRSNAHTNKSQAPPPSGTATQQGVRLVGGLFFSSSIFKRNSCLTWAPRPLLSTRPLEKKTSYLTWHNVITLQRLLLGKAQPNALSKPVCSAIPPWVILHKTKNIIAILTLHWVFNYKLLSQ